MTTQELGSTPEERVLEGHVYAWIRDKIIDGTFEAGSRLRERVLAEALGVSRVPIREAFPRLRSEGYIHSSHNKGAVVTSMGLDEINELFTIRLALEPLAAKLAAQRSSEGASMNTLRVLIEAEELAIATGDRDEIADATAAIHNEIVTLSGNRLLEQLMVPVRGRIQRLFHTVTERDERHLQHEHQDLCSAIILGQSERAGALATAHIERSRYETMPIVRGKFAPKPS